MQNEKIIITVCSKNIAKNNAVENVANRFFNDYDIKSLETNSKVSETPNNDNEGITGCHNRIKDAINQDSTSDLYIAMEGILSPTDYGTFLCGWTVIYNNIDNEYYYGCSAKVKVPNEIIAKTTKDKRLSDIVAEFYGDSGDNVSKIGTNGIITHGSYTRTDEFIDSVLCAMASKFKEKEMTK